MWGNRLGWTISAVILLITGGLFVLIARGPALSKPTAFSSDPRHFQPLRPPGIPPHLFKSPPASGPSAAYRRAIELYLANRPLYDDFAAAGKLDSSRVKRLEAVNVVVAASAGGGGRSTPVFADRPTDLVNYDFNKPPIDAIRALGRVTVDRLALLSQRSGAVAEAKEYAEAAFAFGMDLCDERLCYAELEAGLELLGKSTAVLVSQAESSGQSDRAAALRAFDQQRQQFAKEQVEPVLRVVRSIDPKTVGRHAGDVFELARRSKERMWRVEAILALGRLRFFAGDGATASDQREAMRYVTELAETETDPVLRAAAVAARDLTAEKHRMQ